MYDKSPFENDEKDMIIEFKELLIKQLKKEVQSLKEIINKISNCSNCDYLQTYLEDGLIYCLKNRKTYNQTDKCGHWWLNKDY